MMRPAALTLAGAAVASLVAATAVLFRMPLDRAAALAPVIVVTAGATVFITLLWVRIVWESLRGRSAAARAAAAVTGGVVLFALVGLTLASFQ